MGDNWYERKQFNANCERLGVPATIRKGSTGEDVKKCQRLLDDNGFPTPVDGVFGSGTEKQVKLFQETVSLTPDGIVGNHTWVALESYSSVPISIDMSEVASLFSNFFPQKYQLSGAQCPSNPPGMSLRRIGMETTNCVLFTEQWSLWMVSITDHSRVPIVPNWGPRVIMEWGAGSPAPGEGPWLVQWFTNTGGHSIIVLADDPDTGKILTLEANDSINGAGWNQIGPLRDVPHPGADWVGKVTQTWDNRVYSKRAVHIVGLNITGVQEWLESV